MERHRVIRTDSAPAALGPYSQAVVDESTGLVFCSGQVGIDPSSGDLAPGGIEAEVRQIFRNVDAMLRAAGSSLGDIVRTTLYLADLSEFAAANAVYAEYLREPYPARATVQVAALPKGARAEIEVTAVRPRA